MAKPPRPNCLFVRTWRRIRGIRAPSLAFSRRCERNQNLTMQPSCKPSSLPRGKATHSNSVCRIFDITSGRGRLCKATMANQDENPLTRRAILKGCLIAGGVSIAGFRDLRLPFFSDSLQENSFQGGQFLGLIEFAGEAPMPLDTAMGAGLDGRLYTDLSKIDSRHPTISNDKFYVRTRAS